MVLGVDVQDYQSVSAVGVHESLHKAGKLPCNSRRSVNVGVSGQRSASQKGEVAAGNLPGLLDWVAGYNRGGRVAPVGIGAISDDQVVVVEVQLSIGIDILNCAEVKDGVGEHQIVPLVGIKVHVLGPDNGIHSVGRVPKPELGELGRSHNPNSAIGTGQAAFQSVLNVHNSDLHHSAGAPVVIEGPDRHVGLYIVDSSNVGQNGAVGGPHEHSSPFALQIVLLVGEESLLGDVLEGVLVVLVEDVARYAPHEVERDSLKVETSRKGDQMDVLPICAGSVDRSGCGRGVSQHSAVLADVDGCTHLVDGHGVSGEGGQGKGAQQGKGTIGPVPSDQAHIRRDSFEED